MTYHQPEAMRKMMTRSGVRWRCIRSIEATRGSPEERDAFGEQQSERIVPARAYQESGDFHKRAHYFQKIESYGLFFRSGIILILFSVET